MSTTNQMMLDRVGQGAADRSAGVVISSQKTLSVIEVSNVLKELALFTAMVNGLKVFAGTYKSGQSSLLGSQAAAMFCVFPVSGSQFALGPNLTLLGGTLNGGHFTSAWNPAEAMLAGQFEIKLDGVTIASRNLKGVQVLPYLFRMPSSIYQVMGGFTEELCSSLLRSDLSGFVISEQQRIALNKTVAGETKNSVAEIANTPVGLDRYALLSGMAVSARIQADDDALAVIKNVLPTMYDAVILHRGIGVAV